MKLLKILTPLSVAIATVAPITLLTSCNSGDNPFSNTYKISFLTGDWTYTGSTEPIEIKKGGHFSDIWSKLPTATKQYFNLDHWEDSSGTRISASDEVVCNLSIKPVFVEIQVTQLVAPTEEQKCACTKGAGTYEFDINWPTVLPSTANPHPASNWSVVCTDIQQHFGTMTVDHNGHFKVDSTGKSGNAYPIFTVSLISDPNISITFRILLSNL